MDKVTWDEELIKYLVESTWADVARRSRAGEGVWEEGWGTAGSDLVKDRSIGGYFRPD